VACPTALRCGNATCVDAHDDAGDGGDPDEAGDEAVVGVPGDDAAVDANEIDGNEHLPPVKLPLLPRSEQLKLLLIVAMCLRSHPCFEI